MHDLAMTALTTESAHGSDMRSHEDSIPSDSQEGTSHF